MQLFDSWAGSLSAAQFERWVVSPNAEIVNQLKKLHPDTPIIGFPKGAGEKLSAYAAEVGADAIGLDETLNPEWVDQILPDNLPVQGNFDPLLLLSGGDSIEHGVARIKRAFEGRPHIFNLGHGIDKETPIAHVERLIAAIRG